MLPVARVAAARGFGKVLPGGGGEVAQLIGKAAPAAGAHAQSVFGLPVRESAALGFAYEGILKPSSDDPKDPWSFAADKAVRGIGGALTFSTMTATSIGLRAIGETRYAATTNAGFLFRRVGMESVADSAIGRISAGAALKNAAVNGIITGLPGGFIAGEYDALTQRGRLAEGSEIAGSIYSMSLVGGAFGAHQILHGKVRISGTDLHPSKKNLSCANQATRRPR